MQEAPFNHNRDMELLRFFSETVRQLYQQSREKGSPARASPAGEIPVPAGYLRNRQGTPCIPGDRLGRAYARPVGSTAAVRPRRYGIGTRRGAG